MRTKLLVLFFVVIMSLGNLSVSRADNYSIATITDVVLVRPGCFLATLVGSVVFVAALPFSAASGSIQKTADVLVLSPAEATFTRPVGDFSTIE